MAPTIKIKIEGVYLRLLAVKGKDECLPKGTSLTSLRISTWERRGDSLPWCSRQRRWSPCSEPDPPLLRGQSGLTGVLRPRAPSVREWGRHACSYLLWFRHFGAWWKVELMVQKGKKGSKIVFSWINLITLPPADVSCGEGGGKGIQASCRWGAQKVWVPGSPESLRLCGSKE